MAHFYFDTSGDPIAFRRTPDDKFLFDKDGNWIGWFPWGDDDVADKEGDYLGTVVGNRLLRRDSQPYRGYPGYPGYPGFAGYPGYHSGFSDVPKAALKG